jgi:hypothetical protein
MAGLLYEYLWSCGDRAGHQFIRSLKISNNRKWFVFQDITTGEKVCVHRDQYPSYRWINDRVQCSYTIKLIEDYGKQATTEGYAGGEAQEPE